MLAILTGWVLGLVLGMRHALEPDHVAAVSSMLAEHKGTRSGLLLGAAWGAGHAITILLVGGALLALGAQMPARVADALELAVAAMLVFLGVRALARAVRRDSGASRDRHRHAWRLTRRPLAAGLVHGLAGSGAITAFVVARLTTWTAGVAFLALFGLGAAMGMALLTSAASATLGRFVRGERTVHVLSGATGLVSLGLGAGWGWPIVLRLLGA
jgi:hypothetical protein